MNSKKPRVPGRSNFRPQNGGKCFVILSMTRVSGQTRIPLITFLDLDRRETGLVNPCDGLGAVRTRHMQHSPFVRFQTVSSSTSTTSGKSCWQSFGRKCVHRFVVGVLYATAKTMNEITITGVMGTQDPTMIPMARGMKSS